MTSIVLDVLLLVAGIGILFFGADWLVRGAARLAGSLGVSPIVVGLTVVSFGTSAPELVVCTVAALGGNPDLALGNVLGSNLANIYGQQGQGQINAITGAANALAAGQVGSANAWQNALNQGVSLYGMYNQNQLLNKYLSR